MYLENKEQKSIFVSEFFCLKFFEIEILLIYSVVLISGVRQSDSVICTFNV